MNKKTAITERDQTPLRLIISEFLDNRLAVAGLVVFLIIVLTAVLGPYFTPQNPYDLAQMDIMDGKLPPGAQSLDGDIYLLGTDEQGRDMFSAIIYGLRLSLFVGIVAGSLAVAIGVMMGLVAAYFGGKVDTIIMRLVDLQLSFPTILVALMLLAILGKGVDKVVMALIIVQWAYYARTIRSTAMVERSKEYIEAAHCLALGRRRIIFSHMLPNCLPPVIVVATVNIARAIAIEATLSFLGVGVPQTEPSLGSLIKGGFDFLLSGKYWISVYPGIALVVTIVAINLVGDHLRDVLNPRLRR
ncbi:ABC transporter permease [bacterium]|nr:ABC transporter permease [bacterium]